MILCLETSTIVCSVALCKRSGVAAIRESSENRTHASQLTVFIDELLKKEGLKASDLDAVAVSKGPGSYTGLRIGVSVAKGIAYAASIPLIGIETTLSMFHGIDATTKRSHALDKTSLFVPMIDARRMEVFYSVLAFDGSTVKGITAEIIDGSTFAEIPESVRILIFGDGASKCKQVIKRENIEFADEFRMSAAYMHQPAFKSLEEKHFEDVAYFEPLYLKDFITSRPKKNLPGG